MSLIVAFLINSGILAVVDSLAVIAVDDIDELDYAFAVKYYLSLGTVIEKPYMIEGSGSFDTVIADLIDDLFQT